MHKTVEQWRAVKAEAVTSGSIAQATNVLQMALDDIQELGRDGWQDISTAPCTGDKDPDRVLVWVADGDLDGIGCAAFGKVFKYNDGRIHAYAEGFNGDWSITRWMPLPKPQVTK